MKAILMSIRPQYVAKILNGEKTIEIRKKFPRDYVGWVYIYCTKDNRYVLDKGINEPYFVWDKNSHQCPLNKDYKPHLFNGKVVARFWCDKVEEYVNGCKWSWVSGSTMWGICNDYEYILKDACLTEDELYDYCEDLSFNTIYITKLEIFDEPLKLIRFSTLKSNKGYMVKTYRPVMKAPQSWQYIEL